jgi:LysR family transcriptional regulator, carnitine catabolism transcriptional activator
MMYPALNKIRTFAAVAAEGSFRKAAEQLHLSQPALSTHIRDLEAALGVPLFHRTTRSVRLTADGERFLLRAKRALDEIESGVLEMRDQATLQRGRVVVACLPTVACHMLPKVVASFSRQYPGIQIQIFDGIAETLVRHVTDREADIGIGPVLDRTDDLEFSTVTHDHFVAVFPQNHPLAANSRVRLKELVKFPLLTLVTGTNVRAILEHAFRQQGIAFRPVMEVSYHYTLGGMVAAGLGITVLPSMAVAMLGNPLLKTALIINPGISREIGIIQRRDQAPTPAAKAFLDNLSETLVHSGRNGQTASSSANRLCGVDFNTIGRARKRSSR